MSSADVPLSRLETTTQVGPLLPRMLIWLGGHCLAASWRALAVGAVSDARPRKGNRATNYSPSSPFQASREAMPDDSGRYCDEDEQREKGQ